MPTLQRRRLLFNTRPFSPANLPGLQLWLRADRGAMKGSPAAQFTRANAEALTSADNAGHEIGNADKTIALWVRRDAATDLQTCIGKALGTGNQREYRCTFRTASGGQWQWLCFSDGGNVNFSVAAATSNGINVWECLFLEHDAAADVIRITINNGTPVSTAFSTGVFQGTAGFALGADAATAANNLDGRLQSVGKWSRILSGAEKAEYFNNGTALLWAQLSGGLQTGCEFFYNCDEESGTRADSSGAGLTLTDVNTVTAAVGNNLTPAGNTDPVIQWKNQVSALYHAEQVTTTKRPLFITGLKNGQPGIRLDGTDDFLRSVTPAGTNRTLFVVVRVTGNPFNNYRVLDLGGLGNAVVYSAAVWTYATDQASAIVLFSAGTGSFAALGLRYNGLSELAIYSNAVRDSVFDPSDGFNNANLNIGSAAGGGFALAGEILEVIDVARTLGDAEVLNTTAYLKARYAL